MVQSCGGQRIRLPTGFGGRDFHAILFYLGPGPKKQGLNTP
jgi:hypothetical protein